MRTRAPRASDATVASIVLGLMMLSSCTAEPRPAPPVTPTLAAPNCAESVQTGPLPEWARGGFTGDGSGIGHVEGLGGSVVGVLFGYPLTSPPRPDRSNKILWVAHDPAFGKLVITAQLAATGPVVERTVGFGGGQSIIDLPSAVCWRLTLHWGENLSDIVDVPYVPLSR